MLKKNLFLWLFTFAITLGTFAQSYEWKEAQSGGYSYKYVTNDPTNARFYTLKNGLTVILSPIKKEPRIQCYIAVKAGSKTDPATNTGLAHYLEHMLFKGTDRYGSLDWEKEQKELEKIDGKLKLHIKLETGMNRIGTSEVEEIMEIHNLFYSEKTEFEGIFSHYSNADGEDDEYDDYQTANFNSLVKLFKLKPKYIHIENSAGTIKYSDRNDICNLSRIGIALYGCYPSSNIEKLNKLSLEPVVSLVSKVAHVKKILKGTKVGYGISYEALEDEYIATIPIGYADGLLRRAQGFKVKVGSEECEIVGRVCMDQLMILLPDELKDMAKKGDVVEFFGENISVVEVAELCGTISYEILCGISQRVPRIYVEK